MTTVLRIDASATPATSTSRQLADAAIARLAPSRVIARDLTSPLPLLDATWVSANVTKADQRDASQKEALALSDTLVAELKAADTIVISTPIYNFSVPAALKAWIDLVARAGVTFSYTENGPKGLLDGKRAILVVSSGGTEVEGPMDFATGYLKHVMGFIGIHDVEVVAAARMAVDPDAALKAANDKIGTLAA